MLHPQHLRHFVGLLFDCFRLAFLMGELLHQLVYRPLQLQVLLDQLLLMFIILWDPLQAALVL